LKIRHLRRLLDGEVATFASKRTKYFNAFDGVISAENQAGWRSPLPREVCGFAKQSFLGPMHYPGSLPRTSQRSKPDVSTSRRGA
jgi:hypothetical protein